MKKLQKKKTKNYFLDKKIYFEFKNTYFRKMHYLINQHIPHQNNNK